MAVTVKKIVLWRKEIENKPGALASSLASLARAGADLQVVMGYRYPGEESKGAIELYPVTAKKSVAAAQEAGLTASSIPTLVVEGDNRAGPGPCDISGYRGRRNQHKFPFGPGSTQEIFSCPWIRVGRRRH